MTAPCGYALERREQLVRERSGISVPATRLGREHDDRAPVENGDTARRPLGEMLPDDRHEPAIDVFRGRARSPHVDDQEIVRSAKVMPQSCGSCRHRRLVRIRPGQQVRHRLAAKPLLDLERRPDLGELERDARDRDVDERTVDRGEVPFGGEHEVPGDLATDPDRHRERLGLRRAFDEPSPIVAAIRRRPGDHPPDMVLDHDPAAEVLGQDPGDAGRPAIEQHLLGESLLDGERSAQLGVRLGQHAS
jgi:hypothetical protein